MMSAMSSGILRAIASLSLCLVFGLSRAQDSEPIEADPPDRAARLSLIQGDVSMQPTGEEEWAPAILNRPLTTGDKLWTAQGARAEVYVGPVAVRIDGDTAFSFLNVDNDTIQMRMTAGVINLTVRALEGNDHIEIDTPIVALTLLRPGNYRVEVNDAGDATTVRVNEGELEAIGPAQKVKVIAQQEVTFRGADDLVTQWRAPGAPDEFDTWSGDREARYRLAATSRSAEYVSPDVTGYEELDDNGTWSSEPEYGNVWTPTRVAVGWSPYQYGRWNWVSPWGWTWIDDAPWGYAPFHYGRWAHVRQRWCWVPGPRHGRAVYAPAQVGWVGGGRLAWFPLGPREVYVPGRHYSRRYLERVNLTNTQIVQRTLIGDVYNNHSRNFVYRNRLVPGAVTEVSRATFTSAGRVGDHRIHVDERELARTPVSAFAPDIAPVRESRLGGATRGDARTPPRPIVDRQVFVRRDPPASSAHFARSTAGHVATAGPAANNFTRPQIQDQPDRVPRSQPPVSEQRAWATRPPEDRPREDRPAHHQQERRDSEARQLWQQRSDQARQQQEQQRQQQQQQARERSTQRPRTEQPRVVQPRVEQPRVVQPRVEQPRVEQPRVQQPHVERPTRSVQPAPSKPPSQRIQDNQPRAQRN